MPRRSSCPRPSAAITRPNSPTPRPIRICASGRGRTRQPNHVRASSYSASCSTASLAMPLLKGARIEQHRPPERKPHRDQEMGRIRRAILPGLPRFAIAVFPADEGPKKFRERLHGRRKPFRRRLRRRAVQRVESPELDFALSRRDDFLLVTPRDDIRNKIVFRVDQGIAGQNSFHPECA